MNNRFLDVAVGIALTSKCRMKHGCIVVKHNRILGISPNVYRNDPRNVANRHLNYCSIHAEARAIRKAGFPKKAIVYVARVNRQGERRYSRPCEGCMSLIEELNCKVIHT